VIEALLLLAHLCLTRSLPATLREIFNWRHSGGNSWRHFCCEIKKNTFLTVIIARCGSAILNYRNLLNKIIATDSHNHNDTWLQKPNHTSQYTHKTECCKQHAPLDELWALTTHWDMLSTKIIQPKYWHVVWSQTNFITATQETFSIIFFTTRVDNSKTTHKYVHNSHNAKFTETVNSTNN